MEENKHSKDIKEKGGWRIAAVSMSAAALLLSAGSGTVALLNIFERNNYASENSGGSVVWNDGGGNYYDGNTASFTEGSIAEVASKVAPSVVSILTSTSTRTWYGGSQSGAGTGMIVTADGYVLTNKHVVDGATTVKVIMDNGETFDDVVVVGTDPLNDVAFLKINGVKDLPAVSLGDSKTLAVGQPVIAIGNALGQYQNTITQGIISGTGRSITASDGKALTENLTDMIQTDAAINPGNSGGPLVNAAGQVIGMNTAVSEDAQGVGFAISISTVKGILKNLVATGKVERVYLGVRYVTITPDVAKEYKLSVKAGAYVYSEGSAAVVAGGPADKAGVQAGDIITAVNGVAVGAKGSVAALVAEYAVGQTVELTILRGGSEMTVKVGLGAYRG
jgi:serine protease Do